MGDPTPLLPPSSPADSDEESSIRRPKSLDDTIEQCIGDGGIRQTLQAVIVCLAWAFDAQQTFINIFTDAPNSRRFTGGNSTCSDPSGGWEWDRPAHTSVVSEWGLDCRGAAVVGLPASAFFIGCVVGGFLLSTLADSSLGRRRMLFLTCLSMSLAGILTSLSPNVWVYAACRFVTGFWRATLGTSSLVLSTEIVGRRQRGQIALVGMFLFTLGFLSLPAIAYLCRELSWRYLYLSTSVPGVVYSAAAFFFVMESPRWLAVNGRREEAINTLKSMAISNGREDVIFSSFSGVPVYEAEQGRGFLAAFSALGRLTERWWSLRRLMFVMTIGFGLGLLYYGMPLAVGDLGANLYWSVAINAIAELPSSAVTSVVVRGMRRRAATLGLTWASCVLSLTCVAVSGAEEVRMAAEVAAFFCTCTAYSVALIYGLELFPTCVRSSALSMLRQAVVMGGVFAPVLVAAGRAGKGRLTFGVFGVVVGVCGSFAAFLPETREAEICDTMEEQEWRDEVSRRPPPSTPLLC